MKNIIIIRLENTMFNTSHISRHLQKAKDRNGYLNTSFPKCKMNGDMVEVIDFISMARALGKDIQVRIVTRFRREVVWRLLRNNSLTWCQVCDSIETAAKGEDKSGMVLFSTDESDRLYAMQNEIALAEETSVRAMGVRKTPLWRAA
ncbi:MAG: hypothetical protein J6Y88_00325 [Bacteroidales bacterium]|nr:hypothetical protein [Bacteroidales bacterium]